MPSAFRWYNRRSCKSFRVVPPRPEANRQALRYRVIPSFDPALWRRASWTVLTLAVIAFTCLGLAEQGTRGGGLLVPPDAPLPFDRHRVFGLDLGKMSSVQALDWLNAAGNPSLALIVLPIDGDVVDALARDDGRETALNAIDTLRQAAGGSPLAVCLHRPPQIAGGLGVAQAAVGAIRERFPDQIIFVSACNAVDNPGWQSNIDEAARPDAELPAPVESLVPLAGGDVILLDDLDGAEDLSADEFRLHSRGLYAMFVLDAAQPLDSSVVNAAAGALADTSHTALVLVNPIESVDPAGLTGSIAPVVLAGGTLPEGFSSVDAPGVNINDQWQHTSVGTTNFLRATSSSAAISAEFIGTDIYLIGIESPESGIVNVWIDPESQTAPPTVVLDLSSVQARDSAVPIASGLPAAHHDVVIQAVGAEGQSVMLSGLFVTGKPATAWTGLMAAFVALLAAVVALSERSYAAVAAIRRRALPPRRRPRPGHPRVFARDR